MRINYKILNQLAKTHDVTLTPDRDSDGPCIHVHECFTSARDAFLAAVDKLFPGKYYREYAGDMTVWLSLM